MARKLFLDTNALIELQEKILENNFIISSISLKELENIKVALNKDENLKFKARQVIHILDENSDKYEIIIPNNEINTLLTENQLDKTPDNIIIASAQYYQSNHSPILFISNDICCRVIARDIFGLDVKGVNEDSKLVNYKGFKEVTLSDMEMSYFYEHLLENTYNLLINEYIVIKNKDNEIVDTYRWDGETYSPLHKKNIKSLIFGDKIKPKDIYQSMVVDSLMKNTITAISGKAGSGKSLLSLMVAMYLIENGKYDRLVVLHNPTPARGAQQQGYYSGSALEKAMQSNIGQVLTTKFGDRYMVDTLLQQEKLKLVAMCDCRGMEIAENEILWITECQNTSVDLLKLCLSRVSHNAKVIVEGDYNSQVDSYLFEGNKNGMKRAIEVLKDNDLFGFIELQNVWRSPLAELVDKM